MINKLGVFFSKYFNTGTYKINLTAWRIRQNTPRNEWASQDISGNAVFCIQKSDGTYVTGLTNPYKGDSTMGLLPDTTDLNGQGIEKIQEYTVNLQEGHHKLIVKFVGATVESQSTSPVETNIIGGHKLMQELMHHYHFINIKVKELLRMVDQILPVYMIYILQIIQIL